MNEFKHVINSTKTFAKNPLNLKINLKMWACLFDMIFNLYVVKI